MTTTSRSGLRRLVDGEAGLHVVGEARRGEEAGAARPRAAPGRHRDGRHMPGMSGIEATRAILEGSPDSAVLMLTVSESDDEVLDAVLAGASGYLLKDAKLADHRRDPRRSRR